MAEDRSDAPGEEVVEVVPANAVAESLELRRLVDHQELDPGHRRKIPKVLGRDREPETRVMGAAGMDPGSGSGPEVRSWSPDCPGDGQAWQRLFGRDDVDDRRDHPEPLAHIGDRGRDRRAGMGVEDQADRVVFAANREGMDLEPRPIPGDRR